MSEIHRVEDINRKWIRVIIERGQMGGHRRRRQQGQALEVKSFGKYFFRPRYALSTLRFGEKLIQTLPPIQSQRLSPSAQEPAQPFSRIG